MFINENTDNSSYNYATLKQNAQDNLKPSENCFKIILRPSFGEKIGFVLIKAKFDNVIILLKILTYLTSYNNFSFSECSSAI